jgi:hypothetical protein
MYTKFEISDLLSKVAITSDGAFLRIRGEARVGSVLEKTDAMVPVLAISSVTVRGEKSRPSMAYPLNNDGSPDAAKPGEVFYVDVKVWDGHLIQTGPYTEADSISKMPEVRALELEVWALNQRWPLSASRAQMVRQQLIAGGMPTAILGAIGQREFGSNVEFEIDLARNEWFKVAANHRTVLGMERATFASGSGYIMLTLDSVILAKPATDSFDFVSLPYASMSAVRLSESDRPSWLKMSIDADKKRHELAIGWALDPNNPIETWSVFSTVPLKSSDAANFLTSRLYRYILKCWGLNYPVGDDLIASLEALNAQYEKGTLAPEALSSLVDGIVNRDRVGSFVTYPLDEPEYK